MFDAEQAKRMRAFRAKRNLSQAEAAKLLGVSQSEISRIEAGLYELTGPLLKLVELLEAVE